MTSLRFKNMLLLLFILSGVQANAQLTQTLRGTVVDPVLQTPVQGATVTLANGLQQTTTDATGNFKFTNVPVGTQTLQVSYTGFKTATLNNLTLNAGKELVLTIPLQQYVKNNGNVIVKGNDKKNRPLNDMSVVSARAFTVEETQRYAASVNDPLRMATNFAGVMGADDFGNNIVIRGNSPSALLWRMEGIDIPNPNHFATSGSSGGGISILSSQLLSNSDFITGAFAAEYGNSVGGVFDLKLRKGNNDHAEYALQAGVLGLNVAAEGPLKLAGNKGSYLVNYRYSTLGLLSKIGLDIPGNTNFQDLAYNIFLPTKKAGTFTLFGFAGFSSQQYDTDKDSSKWEQEADRYGGDFISNTISAGITHTLPIGSKTTLRSAINYSNVKGGYKEYYTDNDYASNTSFNINNLLQKIIVSSTLNHKFNKQFTLRSGVVFNQQFFNYYQLSKKNKNAPLEKLVDTKAGTQTLQSFAQVQIKPADNITFNTGVHFLYLFLNNTHAIEGRSSVKWDINRRSSLAFAYGQHSQMQALGVYFAEMKTEGQQTFLPNKNLPLTRSDHYVLSFSQQLASNLRLKAELYYQHLYNVPVANSDTSTLSTINIQEGYVNEPMVGKGKGRNYGIEISLEKYLDKGFYLMWSNSFYQSKYTALDGIERNTRYNGNYITNLVAGKEFVSSNQRRTYGINIKTVLAGGWRQSPVDEAKSIANGYTIYFEKDAFSEQMPAYFRTDIGLSVKWNRTRRTTTLSLDIQNVTNRKNLYGRYYDPLKGGVVNNYMNGMIPILNYKVEF